MVAAIAVFNIRGRNNPSGDHVAGTIGTVEKYRSEQIQPGDVQLDGIDPAQAQAAIELEYTAGVSWYGGLDEVPFHQDVPATYDELATLNLSLDYKKSRHSIGYVDNEKGHAWSLSYDGNLVNEQYYSRVHGGGSIGWLTPIDHSSIWLRGWAGYSFGYAAAAREHRRATGEFMVSLKIL